MNLTILTTIAIQLTISVSALAQQSHLQPFDNLVGGVWVFEGTQLAGQEGRTEYHYEYGLDGKIVKLKLYTTGPNSLEFGLRNEGIRAWSTADSLVHFYEFDKHGDISTGIVSFNVNDIYYDYEYQGMMLRDAWEIIDVDTYKLTVGICAGEAWKVKIYQAKFV